MGSEALGAKKKGSIDARKAIRSPLLVLEVKGKYYNKIFIGYTKNVSKDGFFLSSQQPLKAGDQFPVEFVLPDNTTKVGCTCEVVWTKEFKSSTGNSMGVGVRFVDLDESKKRTIDEWVIRTENKKRISKSNGRRATD
jgi:uncharacterized protein (TIGR02266 family)